MAEGRTDDRPDTEVSREEDDTTATEPVVDRIRQPATDKGTSDVGTSVDNAKNLVGTAISVPSPSIDHKARTTYKS